MKSTNEQLTIGQRVRVIDSALPQYGQFGMILSSATATSWYVRLDDGAADRTFFQTEELEVVSRRRGN